MEKPLEILDLPENVRRLVGECELTGRRTLFARNGQPVVALVSFDEYMALKETIDIGKNAELRAAIDTAEKDVTRSALMLVEDLLETMNDER